LMGDASYMMAKSELATAVMMGVPFTGVLTDNRGYGCINRLQAATGGAPFNNLLRDSYHVNEANLDFVAHARAMGANAVKAASIEELEDEMRRAKSATIPTVIVIDTDPMPGTGAGGTWWDVAVPTGTGRQGRRDIAWRARVNTARDLRDVLQARLPRRGLLPRPAAPPRPLSAREEGRLTASGACPGSISPAARRASGHQARAGGGGTRSGRRRRCS